MGRGRETAQPAVEVTAMHLFLARLPVRVTLTSAGDMGISGDLIKGGNEIPLILTESVAGEPSAAHRVNHHAHTLHGSVRKRVSVAFELRAPPRSMSPPYH